MCRSDLLRTLDHAPWRRPSTCMQWAIRHADNGANEKLRQHPSHHPQPTNHHQSSTVELFIRKGRRDSTSKYEVTPTSVSLSMEMYMSICILIRIYAYSHIRHEFEVLYRVTNTCGRAICLSEQMQNARIRCLFPLWLL